MGEMEKRLLMFFAVTFVAVSLWPRIFPAPEPVDRPVVEPYESVEDVDRIEPGEASPAARTESAPGPETPPPPVDEELAPEAAASRGATSERTIVVETSLYEMKLSNRGARMVSFKLKEHEDSTGAPYEMVSQVAADQLNIRPLDVQLDDSGYSSALKKALYASDAPSRVSVRDGEERVIELDWADGRGLEVTKRLTVVGGTYRMGLGLSVKARGQEVAKSLVYGAGIGDEVVQSRYTGVEKGVVGTGGDVVLVSGGDIKDGEGNVGNVAAAGVASHYFTALMLPERSDAGSFASRFELATIQVLEEKAAETSRERDEEQALVDREVITAHVIAQAAPMELTLYVGPKKFERLQALGSGMENIIEFGSWMRYPALVLRSWLLAIYDVVGNYGWAIVLLTVFINVLLIPLKHYSFVSMRKMQKIAPQTQKIRERYKKVKPTDPRYHEMNQEMQALYKEHGVNPVSGCLPMLLMIPFFFAFYRMLMASVELRHAPFVWWVTDLAVHDPMFVLPILMGGTQLAIQKMTPQTSADPVQAKIMSFMPIMFTLILAWAPAGLVLYWFSNNLVSMAQQKITNRLMGDKDAPSAQGDKDAKGADPAKPVKSVKTGKKRRGKKGGKSSPA